MHAELGAIFAEAGVAAEAGSIGADGFYSANTKRVIGLIPVSPATRPHIISDVAMGLCDSHRPGPPAGAFKRP